MLLQRLESLKNESIKLHQQQKVKKPPTSTSAESLARPFANIGKGDILPARNSDLLAMDGDTEDDKPAASQRDNSPESSPGLKTETTSLGAGTSKVESPTAKKGSSAAKSDTELLSTCPKKTISWQDSKQLSGIIRMWSVWCCCTGKWDAWLHKLERHVNY